LFTLSDIKKAADNIVSAEQAGLLTEQQSQALDNFQKTYPDRKTQLDSLGQYFVDSKNPIDFIKFLELSGSQSSITSTIALLPQQSSGVRRELRRKPYHCRSMPQGVFRNITAFL